MNPGGDRGASGPATVAAETELKLRLPPASWHAAQVLPLLQSGLQRGQKPATRKLSAVYFDTPDMALSRQRIALRVRREGRHWVQAVKDAGVTASGVHQRLEIETVLRRPHPDLSALPPHPVSKILRSKKIASALVPVVQTEITRVLRLLQPAPGVLIEVAMDRGFIRGGRRREAVCEIELELKAGPLTALFDLAQQLAQQLPVALEHRSKAERGFDLFRGGSTLPAKAAPVVLDAAMSAGRMFRVIAAAALTQVHANERGVMHGGDPEYLHQMRVGIRRLRSAFRLFRDLPCDSAAPQAAMLRGIAAALGPARDWDVLVTETLPALRPALTAHGAAGGLEQACERARKSARSKLKKSIKSNIYNTSMVTLGGWLAGLDLEAGDAAWRQSARDCATRILAACHARVLKRGRHLERRTAGELHRLRIAVKQLRYAIEFFSSLYSARGMATMRERLALLQDILGRINDAASVKPMLDAVAADHHELLAATGIVIGWCEAHAVAERKSLQPAWRCFRAARRPWQE